ncbi:mannosyltransferase [Spathaspora passalidarum NRRL Y-27907]|uniref:Mannosyltransferase n=1 Tax=Spathaspora passalidarum (strain NRRL Y-27907 / 11-Y1) TaxID=619300 RepID=G3AHP1_SPAPN|nr:mannosyltransferase [Spathaspora passalidarum NRRL Y-27907]EGW34205.1 mannosyltransferase [Spathaspora passalidarum NRRL Y-27907]
MWRSVSLIVTVLAILLSLPRIVKVNDELDNSTKLIDGLYYTYCNDSDFKDFLKNNEIFSAEVNQDIPSQVVIIDREKPRTPRENATFLMLCRNQDMYQVLETLQNVQDRFNHKYNYDYTFLNDEPFSKEFIYLITSFIDHGRISFGSIPRSHWSYPSHINTTKAEEIRSNYADVPYGDSESYRHMCRFYSGFFYQHPLVKQYQYYWRIEPGIKVYCDVNYDVFRYVRKHKKKYAFVLSLFEYADTIPSLWNHVLEFIRTENMTSAPESFELLLNKHNWYNLCHFWSNFEIANLDMFDNNYQRLFEFLDSKGGFYYERWGDAPIHSIAVALYLYKNEIHWFNDLGYYYAPYSQCPQDSKTFIENKCTCDPDDDFGQSDLSCNRYFLDILSN